MVLDQTPHLTRPIIGTRLIDKTQVRFMVIVDQIQSFVKMQCANDHPCQMKSAFNYHIFLQCLLSFQTHLDYTTSTLVICHFETPLYLIYHHVRFARPTKIQDDDLLGTLFVWSSVVSFCYGLKTTNPWKQISRKTELVSVRVNVTLY